jgi:LL-diaminopimelate aminotransferase
MSMIDKNVQNFSTRYLFPLIEEKVHALKAKEPCDDLINLGIGDIALPLTPTIVEGIKRAADLMGSKPHGYGPSQGHKALRERVVEVEYDAYGIRPSEIYISDGINSDICALQELFSKDLKVGICDPTYPVYKDLNLLAGRCDITFIPCVEENHFQPLPPDFALDLVYLCSPSNPTGTAMNRALLRRWVEWALIHNATIFFDAAYAAFISSPDVPKSIYEIEGAKNVAIELRSFSKSAGFTGLRLGYTIIPKELKISGYPLGPLWLRRQDIKTNGVSFISQMAGLAALSEEGQKETQKQINLYKHSCSEIKQILNQKGLISYGGVDAPYVWWKVNPLSSWDFFDFLLHSFHIISIPGLGFGPQGEGFIRLSGFQTETRLELIKERLKRIPTKGNLCESI